MPSAIKSQGTVIAAGDETAGGSYTAIENVVSITGPGGSAAVIDASHLSSTQKEKLMGLPDEGQIQLVCNYDPDAVQQTELRTDRAAQTRRFFQITMTDTTPTTVEFAAYVLDYNITFGLDEKAVLNVTLEIDGGLTFA